LVFENGTPARQADTSFVSADGPASRRGQANQQRVVGAPTGSPTGGAASNAATGRRRGRKQKK